MFPQIVAENDFQPARSTAGLFIRPRKRAAQNWFDPENIEKFRAHFFSAHALRFLFADQCEGLIAVNSQV